MTRNARRRRRCGARIEMRERAPSVDVHVHVGAEVLGELADAEIRAAAGDGGGEIEPALHERVALARADDVRGAADGARRDAARGGGARAIARRDAGRDARGGVGGGEGEHLEGRAGGYDAARHLCCYSAAFLVTPAALSSPAAASSARDKDSPTLRTWILNQETTSRKCHSRFAWGFVWVISHDKMNALFVVSFPLQAFAGRGAPARAAPRTHTTSARREREDRVRLSS